MKGPMRVYYDEEGDFLEISVGIFNFKKRAKDLKDIKLNIPIEVNFSAISS